MDPLPDWPHRDDLTDAPDETLRSGIAHADHLLHLAGEFDPKDGGPLSLRCSEVMATMARLRADCVRELARRSTKRAERPTQPATPDTSR